LLRGGGLIPIDYFETDDRLMPAGFE